MRSQIPTIHCDGQDGFCTNWEPDYYEQTASSVDGVKITATTRYPGWVSSESADLCPDCARKEI